MDSLAFPSIIPSIGVLCPVFSGSRPRILAIISLAHSPETCTLSFVKCCWVYRWYSLRVSREGTRPLPDVVIDPTWVLSLMEVEVGRA